MKHGWTLAPAIIACGFSLAGVTAPPAAPVPSQAGAPAAASEGCRALRVPPGPRARGVILVLNDTMRRDRIGVYGGPARTPVFDAFAREHLMFERACTQAPWTTPSVATLFTSLYPSQHGVLSNPRAREAARDAAAAARAGALRVDVLDEEIATLAEAFKAGGYRTAAFVGNPWLQKQFGFAQGFDTYDDSFAEWDVPGMQISNAGLRWLSSLGPDDRFFLYLHYMDSHQPYPPLDGRTVLDQAERISRDVRPMSPRTAVSIRRLIAFAPELPTGMRPAVSLSLLEAAYEQGLTRFDEALGALLAGLKDGAGWERTAVIVTSDHGEALYDRGFGNHGSGLYDDEVAVPLAARLPGVTPAAGRVSCLVGLVDLMPTLCGYAGLGCPKTMFGRSLFAEGGRGVAGREHLVTEGVMHKPSHRAIRDGTHKLILQSKKGPDGTQDLLFDLSADPGETRDLLGPESSREARAIFERLSRSLKGAVPAWNHPGRSSRPLDPEELERLRSLGYIQ